MPPLSHIFSEHDEAINAVVATFFKSSLRDARALHPRYGLLWRELARVSQSGGKRLRPKMTIMAYQAFGGTETHSIIPVAAAQEMLHASLLIHDDIIDRELTRRGGLNVSGAYEHTHYSSVADTATRRHFSDSAALLGGNLLLASAFKLMNTCTLPRIRIEAASNILQRIVFEVAGGQLLDTEMAFLAGAETDAPAELIARYKTASYSFIGPLLIGAVLAEADEQSLRTLEEFAINIGIAYQLNDDLLGTFGDETETGKSSSSDLREGKKTFLIEQFLMTASPEDMIVFTSTFGTPDLDNHQLARLKQLIEISGAKAETEVRIEHYAALARQAIAKIKLSEDSLERFEQLVKVSTQRKA